MDDPASVITLCKENIQPLRHGRNAAQLGTALRAQEDVETQQMLLQEKQAYEDAIKNDDSEDQLEKWYEYICWVEQSYPKNGHECHVGKLLQQCLATFEKETRYHQDRRYIRLWINYISMQKNPLELYQLLYNNGIGTMVADMYRAWAFELEQVEDYKRADEIYALGKSVGADPRDELEYAHQNFQLSVARRMLGTMEERNEIALSEQRQAFSSLRAIKSGRRVTSVRTGHRVRDYMPGVVPQTQSHLQGSKGSSRIQIYEDTPAPIESRGSSILDHVPIEDSVHKENTIRPGPWSHGSRKHPLIPSSVKSGFKIHEDISGDSYDLEKIRLFPNHVSFFDGSKYVEHTTVPVFVGEQPSARITKPHYSKELVYANNADRSMEEIRAELYMMRSSHLSDNAIQETFHDIAGQNAGNGSELENQRQLEQEEMERIKFEEEKMKKANELIERQRREQYELQQRLQAEELQRQQFEAEKQKRENERIEAEQREIERRQAEQRDLERQRAEQHELVRQRTEALERQRIEAERIEAERIESQRMEAELSRQQKLQSSSYLHHNSSGAIESDVDHLLGQSMTVNTKEAMSVVQELWQSPQDTSSHIIATPMAHRMPDARSKFSFDIHMDSSMTQQHAMSSSKHHPSFNIQSYHDQENHQQQYAYPNQQHLQINQSYQNHEMPDPYQYQMPSQQHPIQIHQSQHIQQPHMMQHHPHHQLPQSPHMPQQHYSPHTASPHQPHVPHLSHHVQSHSHSHSHSQSSHLHGLPPSPHQPAAMPHQSSNMHQQHHMYNNMHMNNARYQQQGYPIMQPHQIESQKQLQYPPYVDSQGDTNKGYKMPELPYIKSPGMNRRDLKYLDSNDNKENATGLAYNVGLDENKQLEPDNHLFLDESLGISPLPAGGVNDTCFTEPIAAPQNSSTPMTNVFRPPSFRSKEAPPHYQQPHLQLPPQQVLEAAAVTNEQDEKLSVIMESTREYTSSSSGNNVHTRTPGFGFTMARDDAVPVNEGHNNEENLENSESLLTTTNHEPNLRSKIQAVHAQSPRTVQRNVDQITSEIRNSCDLRVPFKLDVDSTPTNDKNVATVEAQFNEPMEEVEDEEFQLPSGDFNPFDKTLISGLLKKIKFPQPHHSDGYVRVNTNLNKFVPSSSTVTLGTDAYDMEKCLGKGTYGTVMKAVHVQTNQAVAMKTQRPAWVWEYYIAREIKARLTNPHMLRGYMDVTKAYVANNASVLVSDFSKYGTLLSVTNQVKIATGKPLVESLAIFFTIEMLQIVEYLHKCQIIHGDIKPDNFLLMHLPTEDFRPTIQLIDFGCSIDMSLFPAETKFTQIIKTEDFTCIEMQTGRPWTYQTDLYCLAASAHCLLFGNYMRVTHTGDRWFINSKMPRYVKKTAWEHFFTELLNIESCEKMPDLAKLRNTMEETLAEIPSLDNKFRSFANVLNKR